MLSTIQEAKKAWGTSAADMAAAIKMFGRYRVEKEGTKKRKPTSKNIYIIKNNKTYKLTKVNEQLVYIEQKEM